MASKNIVLKGATYNGVESITLPTSPSGTATFCEISDTTATASDVLNSKYFYTAAGVKTQGTATGGSATLITKNITQNGTYNASSDNADGYSSVTVSVSGGGGDSWSWMGKNPTKVTTFANNKVYFEDTAYSTWTPSTTNATIVSSQALTSYQIYPQYDYIVYSRFHAHYEYGAGAEQKAMMFDNYSAYGYNFYGFPSNLQYITSGDNNSMSRQGLQLRTGAFYKNSNGTDAYTYSSTYALYPYTSPSADLTSSSGGFFVTPYTHRLDVRCNASYFSTTNATALDQSTSFYEEIIELWRVDSGTSPVGGAVHDIRDMWLNGI